MDNPIVRGMMTVVNNSMPLINLVSKTLLLSVSLRRLMSSNFTYRAKLRSNSNRELLNEVLLLLLQKLSRQTSVLI